MRTGTHPRIKSEGMLRSKTLWLVNIVQRGEQRSPRGPGRDRGDQHGLDSQRQIARRTQRKCPEQSRELIADRGAGKPARDRFGEAETEHGGAAADQAAFQAEPEKMPQEAVGDVSVAGADEMQYLDDRAVCRHRAPCG